MQSSNSVLHDESGWFRQAALRKAHFFTTAGRAKRLSNSMKLVFGIWAKIHPDISLLSTTRLVVPFTQTIIGRKSCIYCKLSSSKLGICYGFYAIQFLTALGSFPQYPFLTLSLLIWYWITITTRLSLLDQVPSSSYCILRNWWLYGIIVISTDIIW